MKTEYTQTTLFGVDSGSPSHDLVFSKAETRALIRAMGILDAAREKLRAVYEEMYGEEYGDVLDLMDEDTPKLTDATLHLTELLCVAQAYSPEYDVPRYEKLRVQLPEPKNRKPVRVPFRF
jgi:hypothetical protein